MLVFKKWLLSLVLKLQFDVARGSLAEDDWLMSNQFTETTCEKSFAQLTSVFQMDILIMYSLLKTWFTRSFLFYIVFEDCHIFFFKKPPQSILLKSPNVYLSTCGHSLVLCQLLFLWKISQLWVECASLKIDQGYEHVQLMQLLLPAALRRIFLANCSDVSHPFISPVSWML